MLRGRAPARGQHKISSASERRYCYRMGRARGSISPTSAANDSFENVVGSRRGRLHSESEISSARGLDAWKLAHTKREQLDEHMERLALPIEREAHALFGTRKRFYRRAGQFPSLISYEDGQLRFHISNGRDPEDDFETDLPEDELWPPPAA